MSAVRQLKESHASLYEQLNALEQSLNVAVPGQAVLIRQCLVCFFSGGHVLLEGPPGVGKTTLSRRLAERVGGTFRRIQMTSDMLPSDLIGSLRPSPDQSGFQFHEGPLFSHLVLADELNRSSPRTQSALLQAMEERTVTVDGSVRALPKPFFVIATQNSFESHGVYPVAENQLDRFTMLLAMIHPDRATESKLYQSLHPEVATQNSVNILTPREVLSIQEKVQSVHLSPTLAQYMTEVIQNTRNDDQVREGVSVRGGLQWGWAARANAFMEQRDFVIPSDLTTTALSVLAHRLRLNDGSQNTQPKSEVIQRALQKNPIPK